MISFAVSDLDYIFRDRISDDVNSNYLKRHSVMRKVKKDYRKKHFWVIILPEEF